MSTFARCPMGQSLGVSHGTPAGTTGTAGTNGTLGTHGTAGTSETLGGGQILRSDEGFDREAPPFAPRTISNRKVRHPLGGAKDLQPQGPEPPGCRNVHKDNFNRESGRSPW